MVSRVLVLWLGNQNVRRPKIIKNLWSISTRLNSCDWGDLIESGRRQLHPIHSLRFSVEETFRAPNEDTSHQEMGRREDADGSSAYFLDSLYRSGPPYAQYLESPSRTAVLDVLLRKISRCQKVQDVSAMSKLNMQPSERPRRVTLSPEERTLARKYSKAWSRTMVDVLKPNRSIVTLSIQ